jgi:hypothetical protein
MPRLARTVARTAVIAGTATAVSGKVASGQEQKAAAAQQQAAAAAAEQQAQVEAAAQAAIEAAAAAAPAPVVTDDVVAQLQKLGELRASGVLSDEEFAALKAKLLNL